MGYRVRLKPKIGVVGTSTSDRVVGSVFSTEVPIIPESESEQDLVGDVFWSYYKRFPKLMEDSHKDRILNRAILEWMYDGNFDNSDVAGNIVASRAASGYVWAGLMQNEVLQKVLERQRRLEELKNRPPPPGHGQGPKQEPDGSKDGDGKGPNPVDGQGKEEVDEEQSPVDGQGKEEIDKKIAELEEEIEREVSRLRNDPLASAGFDKTVQKAQEKGKEVADAMVNWGIDPANITQGDADTIIEMAQNRSFADLADKIGRNKQDSMKVIEDAKQSMVRSDIEAVYSRKISEINKSQLMRMVDDSMDEAIRLQTTAKYIDTGLFGFRPVSDKQQAGSSLWMLDMSGSVGRRGAELQKSIALGVTKAVQESLDPDRYYEIWDFSSGHFNGHNSYYSRPGSSLDEIISDLNMNSFPRVTKNDDWKQHLSYVRKFMNGGTDFIAAFALAIVRIREIVSMGYTGLDMVFSSDGYSELNETMVSAFNDLRTKIDVRMIYFQFGSYGDQAVRNLADVYIEFPDFNMKDEEFLRQISRVTAEHFLGGYGGD